MMRRYLLISTILFLFVISNFASRKMIIVMKDGTQISYETSVIEKIYYTGNEDVSDISGKWYGDKGIRTIYINNDDVYSIQLENGYSWSGRVIYENDVIKFETPLPIPIEYFLNFDINKEIALQAQKLIKKPDQWLFVKSETGTLLSGQKNCFIISFSNEKLFDIDFVARKSEWIR